MFAPEHPVAQLRGADYNPRKIDSDSFEKLKASIASLGMVKPVIATREGLIVAGHQRTKAARALGLATVPVYFLPGGFSQYDEVRFNQLHNGTDVDRVECPVTFPPSETLGFEEVPFAAVQGNLRDVGAIVRKEIATLIAKHGNWGGAVATLSGEVVSGQQYALACQLVRTPVRVYRIADAAAQAAREAFGRAYGIFSYDHLPRDTWMQSFAQRYRLRDGTKGKASSSRSALYERHLLPRVTKKDRILDFGAGQLDYVKHLAAQGYDIRGVEFFHRKGVAIDSKAVHRMIDRVCADLAAGGRFDVVICEQVLAAVDSAQAERDVLTCLNALCRPGGLIFLSGRLRTGVDYRLNATAATDRRIRVEFPDEGGFSGTFMYGRWFYQHLYTKDEAKALGDTWAGETIAYAQANSDTFQIAARKTKELPVADCEASLSREFDLPWPNGHRVGRAAQAVEAFRAALARDP